MEQLLRDVINRSIEAKEVAGVNLFVVKDGKEICFLSEGMANVEEEKKMERDTIFRLYSQTKPICAAAAMILMERGWLDLYQPVSDFLPGFKNQKVLVDGMKQPVKREAYICDLLQMTSGLFYPDENSVCGRETEKIFDELEQRLYSDQPMTTVELANRLGQCTLEFEPGSKWNYGTSADVLGAVIEIVAQMPLSEFMAKEIFEPLGMKDTGFWVPREKQHRLAKSYETVLGDDKNNLVLYEGNHLGIQNRLENNPAYVAGGAGLASTLDDYMQFAQMLLKKGELNGNRILREATVDYFINGRLLDHNQNHNERNDILAGCSYGNLMRVCTNPYKHPGLACQGEYGWDGWLGTHFSNFPKENMTILIGMQKKDVGMWSLTRKLRNVILSYIS